MERNLAMDFPNVSDKGVSLPIWPKAIAFDLDGTLLDYDGRLDVTVARAVRRIMRADIRVFIITGRMEAGCACFWRELGLDTPMATCNGAHIGFPDQPALVHEHLTARARDVVLGLEAEQGLYVNYYIDNHVYTLRDGPQRDFYSRHFYPVERVGSREDILALPLPEKCLCVTGEDDQERVAELFRRALGDEAGVTRSNPRFTEILPRDVDKGAALRFLAHWGGIPLDNFVAVGDAMNDRPMLQTAGFAIAFNSGDPSLARDVDMILPPLWEDGMDILTKCILGMTNSGRFLTPRSGRFFRK